MPTITDNLNLFKPDPGQSGVAAELNTNWDQLDFRFDEAGGHTHDGTPGQGPKVPVTSLATTGTPSATTYLRGDGLWTTGTGSGSGVTDHGALTGLTDDDHPQYANQSRGDARYAQKANNLSDLANTATARTNIGAAAAVHSHAGADITTGTVPTARLGSGTPSTTTFLRGDQTWAVPGAGGSVNLDDLADVLITSPADNQVLSYDAAGARWINEAAAAGGATTLDQLTDTTITTPADNQVLTYDSTTSQWRNEALPAGGSVATDAIWDAAGDLAVGSGANTAARLAIGTAGHVLTSTGSAAAWQAPAGGGSTLDPLTTLTDFDEFISGTTTTGNVGKWGWGWTNGATAYVDTEANHPGILRRTTSATPNQLCHLFPVLTNVRQVLPASNFDLTFVVRLVQSDTDTTIRIGLGSRSDTSPPTDGLYFEKLGADTAWFIVSRATTETRSSSGVATTAGVWRKLRIRRVDASTIGFTIDAGTEQLVTATLPTTALIPMLQHSTATSSVKSADLDLVMLTITGLTR